MKTDPPVSIGVPVYNGQAHLKAALESLSAQDYRNFEIVISDNASTDRTGEICRRFVEQHPNVRYYRNPRNLGSMENFRRVLEHSHGEYFMWAAHDDQWLPNYVSALADRLDKHPEAVLATPTTIHLHASGKPSKSPIDRAAGGRSPLGNLRVLYADAGNTWIYGLYRREWVSKLFREFETENYPAWGGDLLWLVSVLLRYKVVGNPAAIIIKRTTPNVLSPKREIDKLKHALRMLRSLTRISLAYPRRTSTRLAALLLSWRFVYRRYVRHSNPAKTLFRFVVVLAGGFVQAAVYLQGRLRQYALSPTSGNT